MIDDHADHSDKHARKNLLKRRLAVFFAIILALTALAAGWYWTPLKVWLDVDAVVALIKTTGSASGPFLAIAGIAIASAIAVPLTFIVVVASLAFEPAYGFFVCVAGATVGAAGSYGLGRILGREAIEQLSGHRVNQISQQLGGHGILAIVTLRFIPVAPFAIINMVAGTTRIRFSHFIIGNLLGMTPGTIAISVFANQIIDAIRHPGPTTVIIVAITVLLISGGYIVARRWINRHSQAQKKKA